MKTAQLIMTTGLIWMAMFGEAFAVSTTRVYSSGVFVLGFIALCALVLVVQLIPALMTLWGMIKGASNAKSSTKVSAHE
jgi:uncharacterized membrane protein